MTPAEAQYALNYQISPIILSGGIAAGVPGGYMSIMSLTQGGNFPSGLPGAGTDVDLDSFFAIYKVIPGGSIIDNDYGKYPFADQSTAGNAIVAQPLKVSVLMICPARQPGDYQTKTAIMLALQKSLAQHNNAGGTYMVATPSFFYGPCIMAEMRDASLEESVQAQNAWQIDFEQPLLTLAQATQQQSALMSKLTNGTQITGQPSLSGGQATTGAPYSLATPPTTPATTGSVGAGIVST